MSTSSTVGSSTRSPSPGRCGSGPRRSTCSRSAGSRSRCSRPAGPGRSVSSPSRWRGATASPTTCSRSRTGVDLHVLPTGGSAAPAYNDIPGQLRIRRAVRTVQQQIESAYEATLDYLGDTLMPPAPIRRPLTITTWLVLSVLGLLLSPVLLAVSALMAAVLRRPQPMLFTRFLIAYLARELGGPDRLRGAVADHRIRGADPFAALPAPALPAAAVVRPRPGRAGSLAS